MQNSQPSILKQIINCNSHEQFLQIQECDILSCIKEHFPILQTNLHNNTQLRDINFYNALKKLIQNYLNTVNLTKSYTHSESVQIIGAQFGQKGQGVDLQSRKNTRATFAMRNSKNQQQLKKDQIFVRLIPRTHNCIHFMVKNHNFPRIECRLSCNQHLQYLVNYLTNKWLRGKVGVGYQIKLYPDPSTYMHKHSNESKRPTVIHQALNNYLMFTDIMAAFGVAQNGCINLLYDITELRKQKQKNKNLGDKEISPSSQKLQFKMQKPYQNQLLQNSKQVQPNIKKQQKQFNIEKVQQNIKSGSEHQDQLSIGLPRKNYLTHNQNSMDYSQVNSIGYQFNAFNSNNILGTLFNINNSNTFLNAGQSQRNIIIDHHHNPLHAQHQSKSFIKGSPPKAKNHNSSNAPTNQNPEKHIQNIRNYIRIVQKQKSEVLESLNDKQQNSIHKSESNFKKQVKTVSITKKKNQTD